MSLPTKYVAHDPYEKPDRYHWKSKSQSFIGRMKESWMSQSQKTRWLKTTAIVLSLITLFWWFSPRGVEIYNEGTAGMDERPISDGLRN